MSRAARTGRCFLRSTMNSDDLAPLAWDDGGPWAFRLQLRPHEPQGWEVKGVLHRGEECMDLAEPNLILEGGLVFTAGKVAPLAEGAEFQWIFFLRKQGDARCARQGPRQAAGDAPQLAGFAAPRGSRGAAFRRGHASAPAESAHQGWKLLRRKAAGGRAFVRLRR